MRILVVGGGGREHALVWKLRQSAQVERIWCAPGNAGIAEEAECVEVDAGDVSALVGLAEKIRPDLTVVGPELPLVNGITDSFRARRFLVVGPSQVAAQLEGSKIFCKEFLQRHNIATARLIGTFAAAGDAYAALDELAWPAVIKADGLCGGKGVLVAKNAAKGRDFIYRIMEKNEVGAGGRRILIEEALEGEELSFIILTDGEKYAPLAPTRDHKQLLDGNKGPNTGGMGAYSAEELLPSSLREDILKHVVEPTLHGLAADGIRYQGFLYFGLILTANGPKVLEFNCRLGDPETQAIMARVDFDLAEVLSSVAVRRFEPEKIKWKLDASVCVVMTSRGYPGKFEVGTPIEGLTSLGTLSGVKVFHSGTKLSGGVPVTSGGRVLGVTAIGANLEQAVALAYEGVELIHFEGMHYRKDIGAAVGRAHSAGD
ncbi:MAG TPA: phosphoribosylamine--glycine ligase [Candidatus Acidoferrum sp.]|nr:phosphoribosylamine--glycine ligase [Candidatus Acidoferrum sp.]